MRTRAQRGYLLLDFISQDAFCELNAMGNGIGVLVAEKPRRTAASFMLRSAYDQCFLSRIAHSGTSPGFFTAHIDALAALPTHIHIQMLEAGCACAGLRLSVARLEQTVAT